MLCICDKRIVDYGLCQLVSYEIQVQELNSINLRSEVPPPPEITGEELVIEFILPEFVVAVAADANLMDTVV